MKGYEASIDLRRLDAPDGASDEPQRPAWQSISFLHIPIALNEPSVAGATCFAAALTESSSENVLVHRQINDRLRQNRVALAFCVLRAACRFNAVAEVNVNTPW